MKYLFRKKPLSLLLEEMRSDNRLRRILGPVALTSLGIGAIIGTGIFVLTGIAAHDKAGPSIILSYGVSGLACIFAAFCYAEFSSMVPVAGSAYTYAYATMGEFLGWIIGWDLVLEYAMASSSVAHGWSHYFQDFIGLLGIKLPKIIANSPFDFNPSTGKLVATGSILDLPAVLISVLVTVVLVKGIKESSIFNTLMVIVKLAVVIFVIVLGVFYIKVENWFPFAPFGYTGISVFGSTLFGQTGSGGIPLGMIAGAATIFYAYIGFDSISTHAEEAKKPNRDVPIAILVSLVICTFLYMAVSAVLTGMVPYNQIHVDAPVSKAFSQVGLPWAQFIISLGAITGITSVLLVLMLSQPRILLAIARDGLLPEGFFGAIHPKYRTPWKSTILTGIFVAICSGTLPLRVLAELVNIGTLFAFIIVSIAVLVMRKIHPEAERPFRSPLFPYIPIASVLLCLLLMFSLPAENWYRLVIWLAIGIIIYFTYGRKNSVLSKMQMKSEK